MGFRIEVKTMEVIMWQSNNPLNHAIPLHNTPTYSFISLLEGDTLHVLSKHQLLMGVSGK
jgi:hypothetical protein